jgi:Ion channel
MLRSLYQQTIGPEANGLTKRTFGEFWQQAARDLRSNLLIAWPIFALLLLLLLGSATLLYIFDQNDSVVSWWDALYFTWVTMATVGNSSPDNAAGRAITSLDVFMGLVLIGVVVWLVTTALTQTKTKSTSAAQVSDAPACWVLTQMAETGLGGLALPYMATPDELVEGQGVFERLVPPFEASYTNALAQLDAAPAAGCVTAYAHLGAIFRRFATSLGPQSFAAYMALQITSVVGLLHRVGHACDDALLAGDPEDPVLRSRVDEAIDNVRAGLAALRAQFAPEQQPLNPKS